MQLTAFDHWLREKFVYETHVQTLRLPESIPDGITAEDLPEVPGRRYKHRFIIRNERKAEEFIALLKENGQMYTAQIVDRDAWYVPLVAPKDNKSVSWWLISVLFFSTCAFFVLLYLKSLVEDPVFRKNFAEAVKIMRG
jgi:hypothetical protein